MLFRVNPFSKVFAIAEAVKKAWARDNIIKALIKGDASDALAAYDKSKNKESMDGEILCRLAEVALSSGQDHFLKKLILDHPSLVSDNNEHLLRNSFNRAKYSVSLDLIRQGANPVAAASYMTGLEADAMLEFGKKAKAVIEAEQDIIYPQRKKTPSV